MRERPPSDQVKPDPPYIHALGDDSRAWKKKKKKTTTTCPFERGLLARVCQGTRTDDEPVREPTCDNEGGGGRTSVWPFDFRASRLSSLIRVNGALLRGEVKRFGNLAVATRAHVRGEKEALRVSAVATASHGEEDSATAEPVTKAAAAAAVEEGGGGINDAQGPINYCGRERSVMWASGQRRCITSYQLLLVVIAWDWRVPTAVASLLPPLVRELGPSEAIYH